MKIKKFVILYAFVLLFFCILGCGTADAQDKESEVSYPVSINISEEASVESTIPSQNTVENVIPSDSKETSDSEEKMEERTENTDLTENLSVIGTYLADASGNPVQLRGISTHGLAWYPDYINEECFKQLKEDFGINVIRLAMYTGENGGYCTDGDKEKLKTLVKNGVAYAIKYDMYVIIDWHILSDGNPNTYIEESKAFFQEMSGEYGEYTNVIYEICNEPNGNVSWSQVKSYAEEIIPVIRENDPDGIILVGTPNWSQSIDQAAADPITGYDNIMYTLHFYAATHKDSLRNAMVDAIEAGLPVFVSEYGICDASGNGAINIEEANKWVDTMNAYGVSYVAWNLSNKQESSAILKNNCSKISGFDTEDLSDSGKWLYEMLKAMNTDTPKYFSENGISENKSMETENTNRTENNNRTDNNNKTDKTGKTDNTTDGLSVTAKVINSWEQEKETYFQYDLTISNPTDTGYNNWTIQLTFSSEIILQDSWNGIYQAEGNLLTISSMDYNGSIEKDGTIDNIGFIIRADESCSLNTAK